MSTELIGALKDVASTPFNVNGLPQIQYTQDDLLTICESHPHPAIRRIAGRMLYTMGQRDHAAASVERLS